MADPGFSYFSHPQLCYVLYLEKKFLFITPLEWYVSVYF